MSISCTEIKHNSSDYKACVQLRDEVLRLPLGLSFDAAELEAENDSIHLACFVEGRLVGCLILKPVSQVQMKMRQVAVANSCQGLGIGKRLVAFSEETARSRGAKEIVMSARETAVGFYEKLGYQREGERFIEVTIPHYILRKTLI